MKKILICASTASHLNAFHLPYIKFFQDSGYEVEAAAAGDAVGLADTFYGVSFKRSLFSPSNIKAWFSMRKILKSGRYDVVTTHTALAGFLTRSALAGIKGKTLVVHTSHGYIFGENTGFKGLLYLLAEKLCAPVTDLLMVMNSEDLELAKKHKLCRRIEYIPGMGYDGEKFRFDGKKPQGVRKVIVYAGEFVKNKNQKELIDAFEKLSKAIPEAVLILAGDGRELENYKKYAAKMSSRDKIVFPGFVEDMPELLKTAALYCSPSLREGLPFNVMEAMASGVPVAASNIKGHRDLIDDRKSGLLYELGDTDALASALGFLLSDTQSAEKYALCALEKVRKFERKVSFDSITRIYAEIMQGML